MSSWQLFNRVGTFPTGEVWVLGRTELDLGWMDTGMGHITLMEEQGVWRVEMGDKVGKTDQVQSGRASDVKIRALRRQISMRTLHRRETLSSSCLRRTQGRRSGMPHSAVILFLVLTISRRRSPLIKVCF